MGHPALSLSQSIPMSTFFKEITLGPVSLRLGGGSNWSELDLGFTTNRNAGMASRETAIRLGFKSDHLLELTGQSNPHDTYITPAGNTVYGVINITPGGAVHVLTAQQIFAEQVRKDATKAGLTAASGAAAAIAG